MKLYHINRSGLVYFETTFIMLKISAEDWWCVSCICRARTMTLTCLMIRTMKTSRDPKHSHSPLLVLVLTLVCRSCQTFHRSLVWGGARLSSTMKAATSTRKR